MENLQKKICGRTFKQQKGKKHGYNSHSCCCYSHCYHSGFDCHYHQKDDKEDIYLRNIGPDYRTACWAFPHSDNHIIFLKQLDFRNTIAMPRQVLTT